MVSMQHMHCALQRVQSSSIWSLVKTVQLMCCPAQGF